MRTNKQQIFLLNINIFQALKMDRNSLRSRFFMLCTEGTAGHVPRPVGGHMGELRLRRRGFVENEHLLFVKK